MWGNFFKVYWKRYGWWSSDEAIENDRNLTFMVSIYLIIVFKIVIRFVGHIIISLQTSIVYIYDCKIIDVGIIVVIKWFMLVIKKKNL